MTKGTNKIFTLTPVKLALILTAGILLFYHFFGQEFKLFKIFELKALDLRFSIRGIMPPSDKVVIVAVDDRSIARFGRWPWPRSLHAEMLDTLKADGAKASGFDIIFSEPQGSPELSNLRALRQYYMSLPVSKEEPHGAEFGKAMDKALQYSDHDLLLAESVRKSNNIVMPLAFQVSGDPETSSEDTVTEQPQERESDNDEPPPELLESLESSAEDISVPSEVKISAFQYIVHPENVNKFDAPVIDNLLLPLPEYYRGAKSLGAVNVSLDIDNNLRWADMLINHKGKYYQPMSLKLVNIFNGLKDNDVKLVHGRGIQAGKIFIPLDEKGRLLINYYGPHKTIKYYSYAEVIEKKFKPGTFKDKIVIAGFAATGLYDRVSTPFSEAMPGVEKHATVVSNILQEDFLHRNRYIYLIDLAFILVIGLAAGFVIPRLSALKGTGIALFMSCIILFSNYFLFRHMAIWVNLVYPFFTLFVTSAGVIIFKYFTEEKDKRFLKATFGSYLAPDLVEEMCISGIMPRLGGESRVITAFFTDIEGFTTLSEKLTAKQVVELLNEYLSVMTNILKDDMGTLDKYEGDAIIAFFGAPVNLSDHALRACQVAVAMQSNLLMLRKKWSNENLSPGESDRNTKKMGLEEWIPGKKWPELVSRLKMRIGINTGEIVVGNVGSTRRMNYTIMGDAVNLAARLETACKQYGIYTMASEYTLNTEFVDENGKKKKVRDMVEARYIDNIIVKGRSEPVRVFEIRAMKGHLTEQDKKLFKIFDEAVQHYFQMKWGKAIECFSQSRKLEHGSGNTNPSEIYLNRCKIYKNNKSIIPDEKWEGIFRVSKK
ncbi:MAG: adenylate/guanylate cyclase domain-containing protein [Desulfobacteraceae bacterium]|nr:adenylate/guanylate cyclase domain-containing protein [Desulfobacteraceae bacterium]